MNKTIFIADEEFEVIGNTTAEGKDGFVIRNVATGECGFIDTETYSDSKH